MSNIKKADEAKFMKEACQAILAGKKPNLTENQRIILTRYQYVVDQYKRYQQQRPDLKVFEIRPLIKSDLSREFGISIYQASIDISIAQEYFNLGVAINQKELNIAVSLQENSEYIERAIAAGDLIAAAMFERNRVNLIKLQNDKPNIDWYSIPFPVIRFAFNPNLLKGGYKKSLLELYAEIKEVETSLNIDSRNHKAESLLSMFDITDVDYIDVQVDNLENE